MQIISPECNSRSGIGVSYSDSCSSNRGDVKVLTEEKLLRGLRSRQPAALEAMIAQYNRYVATILTAVLGANAQKEDVEELSSDVFVAVWNHADALKPGKVRAYIGATARNTAKSFLRKQKRLPMDEDELMEVADCQTPEHTLLKKERRKLVREAVLCMEQPDREIFLRYYYYLQPSAEIAQAMGMGASAVRARLMRGRNVLRNKLCKEDIL